MSANWSFVGFHHLDCFYKKNHVCYTGVQKKKSPRDLELEMVEDQGQNRSIQWIEMRKDNIKIYDHYNRCHCITNPNHASQEGNTLPNIPYIGMKFDPSQMGCLSHGSLQSLGLKKTSEETPPSSVCHSNSISTGPRHTEDALLAEFSCLRTVAITASSSLKPRCLICLVVSTNPFEKYPHEV